MRLLLSLKSLNDCSYDLMYYHKLQGFIYNLLRGTNFSGLHDKKGYKFFCFSNIFLIGDLKEGENRKLLISSPDKGFILTLGRELDDLKDEKINIGEMFFELKDVRVVRPKSLGRGFTIASATPIIIRIPEENYEKYGIASDKKRYVFWRPEYSFEAFVKQLEENLFKKYNRFFDEKLEEFSLFEQYQFLKPVVNHVVLDGTERIFVGSTWKFIFSYLSKEQKRILEFGLDCGFGERNSLGFGFMNVENRR